MSKNKDFLIKTLNVNDLFYLSKEKDESWYSIYWLSSHDDEMHLMISDFSDTNEVSVEFLNKEVSIMKVLTKIDKIHLLQGIIVEILADEAS